MKTTKKANPRIVSLTELHKIALKLVINGADVRDPGLAKMLREIEATKPEYISVGDCQMGPYGVKEVLPYFGAIATSQGVRWARS